MKAHQILITDDGKIPKNLPDVIIKCTDRFKRIYSDLEYHLYSGEEIQEIIKNNFDKQTFLSYEKLNPFAYKCDLARMCLLYLYGGIYSDLCIYHLLKINLKSLENFDFCAFRDRQVSFTNSLTIDSWSEYSVSNTILHIKKNSKIIESYIELVIENCRYEYYGNNCLDVTGPLVLGKSMYKTYYLNNNKNDFFKKNIKLLGKFKSLTFGYKNDNPAFITNDGDIVALSKKPSHNFFCRMNGNDYGEMYCSQRVYNKDIKI